MTKETQTQEVPLPPSQRYICTILEDMREVIRQAGHMLTSADERFMEATGQRQAEVRVVRVQLSMLRSLVEEMQVRANRMEAGLYDSQNAATKVRRALEQDIPNVKKALEVIKKRWGGFC